MTDPAPPPRDPGEHRRLLCIELVELVTPYLEGEMSPADEARVVAHLELCPGCAAYVEQMRQTIEIAGRLTPEKVPDEALERLLPLFRAGLGRADPPGD